MPLGPGLQRRYLHLRTRQHSAAVGEARRPRARSCRVMSKSTIPGLEPAPTRHAKLVEWVREIAELTQPDRVHWCDGSDAEWTALTEQLVQAGTLKRLNAEKRPNSFYAA